MSSGGAGPDAPTAPGGLLARAARGIAWVCRAMVVLSLFLVFLFTVGQVADRYVLHTSFSAHDQIARLALVWLTFLGFAVGVWERVNIRVEVLDRFLPAPLHRGLALLMDLGMVAVAMLVLVEGWRLLEVGAYQAIMGTPFTYEIVYAGLLVGMAVLVLFLAVRLIGAATGQRLDPQAEELRHDHR